MVALAQVAQRLERAPQERVQQERLAEVLDSRRSPIRLLQHLIQKITQRALSVTQRDISVTQRALNVTQRALNVTQRALSVSQRALK